MRSRAAAPGGGRRPTAGVVVWAAFLRVTLDVPVLQRRELKMVLREEHRYQRERLQLQQDKLLAAIGEDVAGVALWAAVLLI